MELTLLQTADGGALTKRYEFVEGKIVEHDYDNAFLFIPGVVRFTSLAELHTVLRFLESQPGICAIRGLARERGREPRRRLNANFATPPEGLRWVMLDIDRLALPPRISPISKKAIHAGLAQLPPCFQVTSCVVQFSNSAGIKDSRGDWLKPGLRAHFWFLLDQPVTNDALKAYFDGYPVDRSLFQDVQIHYTAAPIIGSGVTCKLNQRLLVVQKRSDFVSARDLARIRTSARIRPATKASETGDAAWRDPAGGLPTASNLMACDFMRWFVRTPSIGSGRYPAARAFASNAYRSAGDSLDFVRSGLDANRPGGYQHTDKLIQSLPATRPISCSQIYSSAYRCPKLDIATGCCRKASGVRTPYALGLHFKRENGRGR